MTENKKITIWIEWSDEDAAFHWLLPPILSVRRRLPRPH